MRLRITIGGKTYEAEVEVLEDDEESLTAEGPEYVPAPVAVASGEELGARWRAGDQEGADGVCRSPLAGVVIRVDVEPGQQVEAEQALLVLEAMKMETQVRAGRAGVVERVHVLRGDSVKAGQALVELG